MATLSIRPQIFLKGKPVRLDTFPGQAAQVTMPDGRQVFAFIPDKQSASSKFALGYAWDLNGRTLDNDWNKESPARRKRIFAALQKPGTISSILAEGDHAPIILQGIALADPEIKGALYRTTNIKAFASKGALKEFLDMILPHCAINSADFCRETLKALKELTPELKDDYFYTPEIIQAFAEQSMMKDFLATLDSEFWCKDILDITNGLDPDNRTLWLCNDHVYCVHIDYGDEFKKCLLNLSRDRHLTVFRHHAEAMSILMPHEIMQMVSTLDDEELYDLLAKGEMAFGFWACDYYEKGMAQGLLGLYQKFPAERQRELYLLENSDLSSLINATQTRQSVLEFIRTWPVEDKTKLALKSWTLYEIGEHDAELFMELVELPEPGIKQRFVATVGQDLDKREQGGYIPADDDIRLQIVKQERAKKARARWEALYAEFYDMYRDFRSQNQVQANIYENAIRSVFKLPPEIPLLPTLAATEELMRKNEAASPLTEVVESVAAAPRKNWRQRRSMPGQKTEALPEPVLAREGYELNAVVAEIMGDTAIADLLDASPQGYTKFYGILNSTRRFPMSQQTHTDKIREMEIMRALLQEKCPDGWSRHGDKYNELMSAKVYEWITPRQPYGKAHVYEWHGPG